MTHPFLPLSKPNLNGNELAYLTRAVQTEWVSSIGEYITDFEKSIAAYVQVPEAVAVQSGTAGLHLALLALGIGPGDEVIVPTLTFIATVNPVRYVGAQPVFMDCGADLNLDASKLETFIEEECLFTGGVLINRTSRAPIKAIIVTHVFGNMAEMKRLTGLAQKYNLYLIEDAAEALGSYEIDCEKHAGAIGHIGVYSFNGNKIITSGGGGMVVSRDLRLLERVRYLSTQAKDDSLYALHGAVGYNYRMINLQAAVGLAQFEQLPAFITAKRCNYYDYLRQLEPLPYLSLLPFNSTCAANYWFYSLVAEPEFPLQRDELLRCLTEHNIQTRPIWGLIHEQKPYMNNQAYRIRLAPLFLGKIINLPCSTDLTHTDITRVVDVLKTLYP